MIIVGLFSWLIALGSGLMAYTIYYNEWNEFSRKQIRNVTIFWSVVALIFWFIGHVILF